MTVEGFDHIVFSVKDLDAAAAAYTALLGVDGVREVLGEPLFVRTANFDLGNGRLLLQSPDQPGPIASFLERRGDGPSVLALAVDDLEATMARLTAAGVAFVGPMSTTPGSRSLFIHPRAAHGIQVQYVERRRNVTASGKEASFGHQFLCFGHRGAPRQAPENTLASFTRAIELGVAGIELDVHLTRDGELVVIHDYTLERTTNGIGLVADHTLAELRALDAGTWFSPTYAGERIPLLAEVIDMARRHCALQVEIKGTAPEIAAAVARVLRDGHALDDTLVTSFTHTLLLAVKEAEPRLRTGTLFTPQALPEDERVRAAEAVNLARWARADALLPHFSQITPTLVVAAHAAGLEMAAWTVDDPTEMGRLAAAGVDRCTTNVPDILLAELRAGRG